MTEEKQFALYKAALEEALEQSVPSFVPHPLYEAMRYSLLGGGKRLRGVMLLNSYHLLKDDWQQALPFACALEMIHAYSLIHDDLPSFDNDTLRRGKPTNHVVFGENIAILAGDGLQSLAFETMLASDLPHAKQAACCIAVHAGVGGMIAGQTADVTNEGKEPTDELVRYIHERKTACLLTAPVQAGLILAGADEGQLAAGRAFGYHFGLAFQIIDDLLDLHGDAKTLGKHPGKDVASGKLTWPALYGEQKSRRDAQNFVQQASDSLSLFGNKAEFLQHLAFSMLERVQ